MLSTGLQDPAPTPDSAILAAGRTAPWVVDAEDPEVVPGALTAFVVSARKVYGAINVNGHYPARVAVAAIEDVVAVLVRMTRNVGFYAGDFSSAGGTAMTRAEALLAEARTELSAARHDLFLDEDPAVEAAISGDQVTGSPA